MKVIICGAGQVGFNIARYLASENADVTVIDQSRELIEKITDSLDVKGRLRGACRSLRRPWRRSRARSASIHSRPPSHHQA
jgi:saccharopine dehydrogenase-like NADP-dependent oxidoreductase